MAVKCGEIICQSSSSFSMLCAFCNLKIFEFDDFVLHFKNIHFGTNGLLKSEHAPHLSTYDRDDSKGSALYDDEDISMQENSDLDEDDEVTTIHLIVANASKSVNELDILIESADSDNSSHRGSVDLDDHFNSNSEEQLDTNNQKQERIRKKMESSDSDYVEETTKVRVKSNTRKKKKIGQKSSDESQKEFKCSQCPNTYKTYATMCAHFQREHAPKEAGDTQLQCPECDAKFNSTQTMTTHQLKHHDGIKCSICDKKYKCKRLLRAHVFKHTGVRNFSCDLPDCNKSFFDPRALAIHKRNTHSSFKKFICDICGYTCRVKESLRVHYRTHTGEKPYECKLCERRFASNSLLNEHMPMHSSERPHVCEVCGANFARRKALYHHSFLHLQEKKFKCKICGNAYAQLSGLAGHMRKHRESMPS